MFKFLSGFFSSKPSIPPAPEPKPEPEPSPPRSASGKIERIGSYVDWGSTYYTFTLEGDPHLYAAGGEEPWEQALLSMTRVGDRVSFSYEEPEEDKEDGKRYVQQFSNEDRGVNLKGKPDGQD